MSATVADWVAPLALTYFRDMAVPGRRPAVIEMSPAAPETPLPFARVITSPAARPACLAGVPEYTPQMSAPELIAGAPGPPGASPPKPEAGQPVLASATEMPMNGGRPICTVALDCPAAICRAIRSAALIGIAYPAVAVPPFGDCVVVAAVFIPMTSPAALASGPPESPSWIRALVWMVPRNVSDVPVEESCGRIVRLSAVTCPAATVG